MPTCAMPTQQAIDSLRDLLARHRATLDHYLNQQAQLGKNYTPPGVANGITEARAEIQRIKEALRNWNVPVEDYPNEEAPNAASYDTSPPIQSIVQGNTPHKFDQSETVGAIPNITVFKVSTSSLVIRIVGAFALGFFASILIYALFSRTNANTPKSDNSELIAWIILLYCFCLRLVWLFYFRMKDCIAIFDNRMEILQDRRTQFIYWDSILNLRKEYEPTSIRSSTSSILKSYHITLKNGSSIIIKRHYQYIRQLEKELFHRISNTLLPAVRSEFAKSGSVTFSSIMLTDKGIKSGKKFTPWNKIVSIDTHRHLIVIKQADSQDLQTIGTIGIPNYFVMIDFVNEIIQLQKHH